MVPIQFQRVIDAQAEAPRDLSSMHAMMSCGSPLHEGLKRAIFDAFPAASSSSTASPRASSPPWIRRMRQGRWSSVGKPLIGTDILHRR
jgi:hypothetical protein